jgi:multidrug efflux pump
VNAIIDAAISHSRTVLGSLVLILIAGIVAFVDIPKEADPDVNIPIIYVSMNHEGISPEDSERLLVRPMEQELRGIEGVKEMRSKAYEGGANVTLEFDAGFHADEALSDVREKVDLAKPELPSETDEPEVHEVNISLFPVLVVTLSGDVPERALLKMGRDLRDEIEGIMQVLEVKIAGDREELVEVVIDPVAIESYGLSPVDTVSSIASSNLLVAAGAQDTGKGRFAIKVPGLLKASAILPACRLKLMVIALSHWAISLRYAEGLKILRPLHEFMEIGLLLWRFPSVPGEILLKPLSRFVVLLKLRALIGQNPCVSPLKSNICRTNQTILN